MTKRLINAGVLITLYLVFLAWYGGWGMSPMTTAEVEQYLANVPQDSERVDFLDRMRKLGADDDGEEIFMLNLNRYKYADDEPKVGVPAAYQSYGTSVIGMIFKNGGHPIYSGEFFTRLLIEDSDEAYWDEVILVRYRSRRDFLAMVTSDAYQEIARDRTSGIAHAAVSPTNSTVNLAAPRLLVLILLLVPGVLFDYLLRRKNTRP
ncbi:MAG TPA: DUF1330 domain-containing protein [Gammaproteobacteria bacterium]|jgi:uncharacterized protein (DUF1330 family)|nr:DUF1330 domain-containing protein [Gammaproteobacteria bacterium]HIK69640.1 DUF1330 domain-containing protein [Pseudomonadales bacterium]